MKKTKIALLLGGVSGEREISIKTGGKIFENLDKSKYEVFKYDPRDDFTKFITDASDGKFDLVFPALHGPYGEDGRLQGLLDFLGIPYIFSGCLASALAMDKDKAKLVVKEKGVPVAGGFVLEENTETEKIIDNIGFPIVIKPLELGSSVGMSLAKNKEELEKGIEEALKFNKKVLLEKYLSGRELTVTILENPEPEAMPVIEIIPKNSEWFDYKSKYEKGESEEVCPANIPDDIKEKVQDLALKSFKAIGCKDLARADFIWDDKENEIYFLEINTIPGMTETSLVPQSALKAGINFPELLDILIQNALKK